MSWQKAFETSSRWKKFDALLQELFDACMAQSEGNCEQATELTKQKFEDIEVWHELFNEEALVVVVFSSLT